MSEAESAPTENTGVEEENKNKIEEEPEKEEKKEGGEGGETKENPPKEESSALSNMKPKTPLQLMKKNFSASLNRVIKNVKLKNESDIDLDVKNFNSELKRKKKLLLILLLKIQVLWNLKRWIL